MTIDDLITLLVNLIITISLLIFISTYGDMPLLTIIRKLLRWILPIIVLAYVWTDILKN